MPAALRAAGARVEVHDDHFAQDARDEDWLAEVGRRGWIILTKDKRIRRRTLEREALLASGCGVFVLTTGDLTGARAAEILAAHVASLSRHAQRRPRPFIGAVTRRGIRFYEAQAKRKGGGRGGP